MIRITRQTDYGILLLSQMANHPMAEVHTAKHAAQQSKIPLPMTSKILKALAKGGLLVSQRGVKGGYRLATTAEHISIGDVIQALEGPFGITECSFNPGACEQEGSCPVQSNWQRISLAMLDALDKIPLSDMVAPRIHPPELRLINVNSQIGRPL
jgi:FeS assembly SUF system regulator